MGGTVIVETVYSNRVYRLANPNGDALMMLINGKFLKNTIHDHVNNIHLIIKSDSSDYSIPSWNLSLQEEFYSFPHGILFYTVFNMELNNLEEMISLPSTRA